MNNINRDGQLLDVKVDDCTKEGYYKIPITTVDGVRHIEFYLYESVLFGPIDMAGCSNEQAINFQENIKKFYKINKDILPKIDMSKDSKMEAFDIISYAISNKLHF